MKSIKINSFEVDNLSLTNIIGLSLLLTSNYYFVAFSTFASINLNIKLVELSFLFIFSIIFFLLLYKISELLKNKLYNRINAFLIYIFCSWIFVQSIQTFFYLSNYIYLPYFISKALWFYLDPKYEFYIRLISYVLPYGICFLIVYLFKNKIFNFLKFFSILGFIFLIILIYRESDFFPSAVSKSAPILKFDYEVVPNDNVDKKRKVIWLLFDEFDPQIAFENDKFLDNFENLKESSVYHSEMYMPAKQTIVSLPAQLMGINPYGMEIKNRIYYLKDRKNNLIHLNYDNTIFARLDKLGLKSNIFSSPLLYCSLYLKHHNLENCKEKHLKKLSVNDVLKRPLDDNLNGIFFIFSPILKIKTFFMFLKDEVKYETNTYQEELNDENTIKEIKAIKKLNTKKAFDNIDDLDGLNTVYYSDIENFLNNESNFAFFHINIPHLSADYANKIFNKKVSSISSSYTLNLKLADIVTKKTIKILENHNDKNILLIFTSDHWFRLKDPIEKNFYPSLFIAKILSDNSKIKISEKGSGIYVQELIYKFFIKEINSHSDIKLFFKDKPYHEPCLTDECLIGQKRLKR